MKRERICITGATGIIGSVIARHLNDEADVIGVSRHPPTAVIPRVDFVEADIGEMEQAVKALAGADMVIHLAAYTATDDDWSGLLHTNIVGTYNVLEAARELGIKRLVFTSSLAVIAGHIDRVREFLAHHPLAGRDEKIRFLDTLTPPRAESLYSASKILGESLCRLYHDSFGVSCSVVRIGEVNSEDRQELSSPLGRFRWCSHADLKSALDMAIEDVRHSRFAIRIAIS